VRVTDGFVEAMVASPLGVTLLAVLESRAGRPEKWRLRFESSSASVDAAVDAVESMSFGDFVDLAVLTEVIHVGPWIGEAPATAAGSYRDALKRVPIAEAVNRRFGAQLHQPIGRDAQQWWVDWNVPDAWLDRLAPLFRRFDDVYGAGQFTWAGLWTVTDPPVEVHEQLIAAWELERGPVGRWWLPVDGRARVFEIHRPADWARLVTEHPRDASLEPVGSCWELSRVGNDRHVDEGRRSGWAAAELGPLGSVGSEFVFGVPAGGVAATRPAGMSALMALPGQRAARTAFRRHLVPDWRSVAERYDGVHLSWAGFITSEGCITDLDGGDVAMLRYWFSERTHGLADVFGEPQRAANPVRSDPGDGTPSPPTEAQQREIELVVHRLLGRRAPPSP
jgi:hypothetical protein